MVVWLGAVVMVTRRCPFFSSCVAARGQKREIEKTGLDRTPHKGQGTSSKHWHAWHASPCGDGMHEPPPVAAWHGCCKDECTGACTHAGMGEPTGAPMQCKTMQGDAIPCRVPVPRAWLHYAPERPASRKRVGKVRAVLYCSLTVTGGRRCDHDAMLNAHEWAHKWTDAWLDGWMQMDALFACSLAGLMDQWADWLTGQREAGWADVRACMACLGAWIGGWIGGCMDGRERVAWADKSNAQRLQ